MMMEMELVFQIQEHVLLNLQIVQAEQNHMQMLHEEIVVDLVVMQLTTLKVELVFQIQNHVLMVLILKLEIMDEVLVLLLHHLLYLVELQHYPVLQRMELLVL